MPATLALARRARVTGGWGPVHQGSPLHRASAMAEQDAVRNLCCKDSVMPIARSSGRLHWSPQIGRGSGVYKEPCSLAVGGATEETKPPSSVASYSIGGAPIVGTEALPGSQDADGGFGGRDWLTERVKSLNGDPVPPPGRHSRCRPPLVPWSSVILPLYNSVRPLLRISRVCN